MSLNVDTKDIWRQIPPEEKIAAMAKAQSAGFLSGAITIVVFSTLAVGFKTELLMWLSILVSPIIFQFASSKAWRDLRPRLLLEYLAARSAARRHAFNIGAKDLNMSLMFKGTLEETYEDEQKNIQAELDNRKVKKVWVALFPDSFVCMSERIGGAELRFAHIINNKFTLSTNEEEVGDYSSDKILYFNSKERDWLGITFTLSSNYPAALIAFEKTLRDKMTLADNFTAAKLSVVEEVVEDEDDEDLNARFL
ncbi:MAG: hypothetical protein R3A13_12370 [Bdellovibrionota bacterium]